MVTKSSHSRQKDGAARPTSNPYPQGHRQRVRDKVLASHGRTLTDYELLEVLLFSSYPRHDVKPIALEILKEFGSLAQLLRTNEERLQDHVAPPVQVTIFVLQEIVRRMLREELNQRPVLDALPTVVAYLRAQIAEEQRERLHVLYLNSANELLGDETIAQGSISSLPVSTRELMHRALSLGATGMVLCHNHPSGNLTPSPEDIMLTRELQKVAETLEVALLDHLIIGVHDFFSFKQQGLL